jgi:hypothetical protein
MLIVPDLSESGTFGVEPLCSPVETCSTTRGGAGPGTARQHVSLELRLIARYIRPNAAILWPVLEQPMRLKVRDLGLVLITIAIVMLIVQLVLDKGVRSGWAGWVGLVLLALTLGLLVLQRRTRGRL